MKVHSEWGWKAAGQILALVTRGDKHRGPAPRNSGEETLLLLLRMPWDFQFFPFRLEDTGSVKGFFLFFLITAINQWIAKSLVWHMETQGYVPALSGSLFCRTGLTVTSKYRMTYNQCKVTPTGKQHPRMASCLGLKISLLDLGDPSSTPWSVSGLQKCIFWLLK